MQPEVQKIAIIGNAGGGKTTLARKLAVKTGLPLIHVDSIQFIEGMQVRPYKESIQILSEIQDRAEWIIDGYGPLDILVKRLEISDQIIFIDLPLSRHIYWSLMRQLRSLWSPRSELPEGSDEASWRQTKKILQTIRSSHRQMRPELLKILSRSNLKDKTLHINSVRDLKELGA